MCGVYVCVFELAQKGRAVYVENIGEIGEREREGEASLGSNRSLG